VKRLPKTPTRRRLQRMEEAASWLQRLHQDERDDALVDAWLDWCQRDPLNQQAFDELMAIWEASGQLFRPRSGP
jgi:ferric-dicitrate binding protein FerR (iron transport regulator)